MENSFNKRINKKRLFVWLVFSIPLVVMILISFGLIELFPKDKTDMNKASTAILDADNGEGVYDGPLDLGNSSDVKAALQAKTDASYMSYKINVNPVFATGKSKGNLMIENSDGNRYLLQVEIMRDDDGQLMYKSPVIKPNQSVKEAVLLEGFEKGEYKAVAYFKAYDPDTRVLIGNAGMKITITINN